MATTNPGPTLHHLDNSQSQRILWLLEELEIPYNLKLYKRQTSGMEQERAPPELKKVHPLGRSPVLEVEDGRKLVESSAIAMYLIDTYDKEGKFKGDPATGNDRLRDETLSSFANSSLALVMIIEMILSMLVKESPFVVRPIFKLAYNQVNKRFTGPDFIKFFTYLNNELGEQQYFMGASPGKADFMMMWPVDFCVAGKFVDLKDYPNVKAWHDRCHARPAMKRSLEKGNGYILDSVK